MKVLTYGLKYEPERLEWVAVEATKYDDVGNPISWAIRKGGYCMSKLTGKFDYEPRPSSRGESFITEYRFSTPEQAKECWQKFHSQNQTK